jgi:hypothetical protein
MQLTAIQPAVVVVAVRLLANNQGYLPLVEVEYKGRQSNAILTTQVESTLKIFGE